MDEDEITRYIKKFETDIAEMQMTILELKKTKEIYDKLGETNPKLETAIETGESFITMLRAIRDYERLRRRD